jgi:DNA-binding IclR family transcriptional regulator
MPIRAGEMVRLAGANRNTLKQQFRQLVDRGYLTRHGGGRTTWYTLRLVRTGSSGSGAAPAKCGEG